MRKISANGFEIPVLGQGSWCMGEDSKKEIHEIQALKRGIELGMNLIDTAEMYGNGKSEILIGKAIKDFPRDKYMLVSKVFPHNAGNPDIFKSCDASLKRLGTDYLDIYLLHWRGTIPLEHTVECMEKLVSDGKVRRWGVSNFDVPDMEELWKVPGGKNCAVNQVLYHIGSRGIEYDLIPWQKERNVAIMAYCPLAQGGTLRRTRQEILTEDTLINIAEKYKISVLQLLLAFVLRQENMIAIPKSSAVKHVEQNAAVAKVNINESDWEEIDKVFWSPTSKMHLDIE